MQDKYKKTDIKTERFIENIIKISNFCITPYVEIYRGIRSKAIPWVTCLNIGTLICVLLLLRTDLKIFQASEVDQFYPFNLFLYGLWCFFWIHLSFCLWGWYQAALRIKLTKRLAPAMVNAELKNRLDQIPSFVSDVPIDDCTKKLTLSPNGISETEFKKKQENLETDLQIFIDSIVNIREKGLMEITYSPIPMPERINIQSVDNYPGYEFLIGNNRAQTITANLKKTPHLLVAGQSGGGKSTFLRQLIATLYLNNKNSSFLLIDLKGGLEFSFFQDLERMKVPEDVTEAIDCLKDITETINYRMELLKINKCKDIEAYFKKQNKVQLASDKPYQPLDRKIIVIDEAAEMFLTNSYIKSKDVQSAREIISKIARQGRAIGLHLIIATQRPDVRSLDPQVKANLIGTLCFQMLNDASSISVLGNGRAKHLSAIEGRAIWKLGYKMTEVQTPLLEVDVLEKLLSKSKENNPQKTTKKTTPPKKDSSYNKLNKKSDPS